MTTISTTNRITKIFSVFISIFLLIGLISCGESVNTDADFESVDTTAPVDWVMVWNDEFDGSAIDTDKWSYEVNCNGGGNQEQQCYTAESENSFVSGGNLNIVALPAAEDSPLPYTSARLNTKYKGDWKYGRFEMRAKMPQGQGTWPAFWMLPTDEVYGPWPKSGEIDIIEAVNLKVANLDGVEEAHVYGTLHYGLSAPDNSQSGKAYLLPGDVNPADGFHTYTIEWQEGEIRWYVDGYLYATQRASEVRFNSKGESAGLKHRGWFTEQYDIATGELGTVWDSAPYDQDFHLLLNLAVGGSFAGGTNNGGIDPEAFANGQTYEIDYVRVYECINNPDTGKGCETLRPGYNSFDDALVEGLAPIPAPPSTGIAVNLTIFDDAENPDWPLWDCCGGTIPTVETDDAEHGAVAEFVIGAEPTVMGFNTFEAEIQKGFDASPMLTTGSVSFEMKVVNAPNDAAASWKFKIESGGATGAVELDLTASEEGVAPVTGEWQTYTYTLQTLADADLDLGNIDVVMIFPAWGAGEGAIYRVDNVRIAQDSAAPSPELVLFEDTTNPDWPTWDCCGGSVPTEETDDEEHGLTAEFVVGEEPTVLGFQAVEGAEFDASSLLAEGIVQFEMKVVNAPNDAASVWKFKIESGDATTAVELDLTASTEGVAPVTGEWQTYTFPVQVLFDAGLDLSAIDVVMVFPAWGTGNGAIFRIDNAKIYNPNASSGGGFSGLEVFKDTVVSEWTIWDCCGGTTPTEQTDDAAHGVTAEFVVGAEPTVLGFLADDDVYFDASAYLGAGVVQFELKVVNAPSDASSVWTFKIEAGDATTAVELALTASQEGVAPVLGEWQTYTYSIQDLFDAGLDISAIDVVLVFPAWGTGDGAIYRVDNVIIGEQQTVTPSLPELDLFTDATGAEWSIWDCCGGSTPTEQVDDAAHGMTAEFVVGADPTVMGFLADDDVYFDASVLLSTGVVQFDMKVVNAPNDAASVWKFKIESGDATTAVELDLTASNEGVAPVTGEWQTYTYSIQDLFDAGLDISAIDVVLMFPAWGTGEGAIYRVDNAKITAP